MNRKGFTLLELLIVILILGVLATLAVPQYKVIVERAIAAEAINRLMEKRITVEEQLNAGNEFTDIMMPISETEHWRFSRPGLIFTPTDGCVGADITAIRKDGDYTGTYIEFRCYKNGTCTWHGDHPGVPRG